MAGIVVPSSDPAYPLYAQITNMQSVITANKNPALSAQLRNQLPALEAQLVNTLFATGKVTPANVMSSCTYGGGDTNSY